MAAPTGILEVRCAGCGETLEVERGLTEFACPDCGMAQALPPEFMPRRPRRALPLHWRGASSSSSAAAIATPVRVACGGCDAVLSVPHGVGRFACPLCGSHAAAVPVVVPPSAVPITSDRLPRPSEIVKQVQDGPSSQPAHAGKVENPIHSKETHKQHHNFYFKEESFNLFKAHTRTQIPVEVGIRNEHFNPSLHRDGAHTEPLDVSIPKPGHKSRFAVGPKSRQAGKVQEEHANQADHASQAQGIHSNSSVHTYQVERGFPDNTNTMHSKPKTDHVSIRNAIEHEQIGSMHQVVHEQQAGEAPSDRLHPDQEHVDISCKSIEHNKKSAKGPKRNKKRRKKSLMNDPNEWSHLRRSKRLARGSPDLIGAEPIQKLDASPNQNRSEAPQIERTIADPGTNSPTWYQCPLAGSNESDDVDFTTPSTLNKLQTEQLPHNYRQMYSPETRCLPDTSPNSWNEHEINLENYNGIDQLDGNDENVNSNLSESQNKYIDGQLEACSGKNHLERIRLNPHSNRVADDGKQKNNGFIGSSNGGEHPGDRSFSGVRHQINLSASCSRLAALLPVPAATTSPIIASPSSLEKLPLNCSSSTILHHQPQSPLYSQDARCADMLSGSVSVSSKKRRGRAPAVLMEPRKAADRPVLTPGGMDNWTVRPPCPKVTTTLSLLIKQNYPGTYVSADSNGKLHELVVSHWHQWPSDVKSTVLDEFLKRYKWSPGHEDQCQKIFDRKAVRQLVNLFCHEKQRVREELAAKKAKRSCVVSRASREMVSEEEDGTEDLEEQLGDGSVAVLEHDDPLKWKPFVPEWMHPKCWEMLCEYWAKDEVMKVSYQKRKNRNAGNDPRLMIMDDGKKLDTNPSWPFPKVHKGKGELVGKKALRTEEQVGSSKHGRHYGASDVLEKAQVDTSSKSSLGCLSKQGQPPMFTQDQVQQMINQALQGLNETWEKKFLSLEQSMRSMTSSHAVQVGAKSSMVAVALDKRHHLAHQDILDSAEGELDPATRDEGNNLDDDSYI